MNFLIILKKSTLFEMRNVVLSYRSQDPEKNLRLTTVSRENNLVLNKFQENQYREAVNRRRYRNRMFRNHQQKVEQLVWVY